MTKRCLKCKQIKPATSEYFHKHKKEKDGLNCWCKECKKEHSKEYNQRPEVKKRQSEYNKEYREQLEIKERDEEYRKEYNQRPEVKERFKQRRATDPTYRLNHSISGGIWKSLKGNKKGRHWETLVGFTIAELKEYLEKQFIDGMTFDNYGDWHIDHIRPISSFNFDKPEDKEFKQCWSLDNLQPIWAEDNFSKHAKWEESETDN